MKESSNIEFQSAFNKLSKLEDSIPPDMMLRLYALYKQATLGDFSSIENPPDLRDAFKFNAWRQLHGMTKDVATKEYIELSKIILIEKN